LGKIGNKLDSSFWLIWLRLGKIGNKLGKNSHRRGGTGRPSALSQLKNNEKSCETWLRLGKTRNKLGENVFKLCEVFKILWKNLEFGKSYGKGGVVTCFIRDDVTTNSAKYFFAQ